jgi:tetratricopeptide (TPR) repeat protein
MNTDWFIKFEEYLQGEMSSEEKSVFESELSANEEMNSAFNVYRTVETEMRHHEQQSIHERELKSSLEKLNARYFKSEAQHPTKEVSIFSNKHLKTAMAIAASILVLLVAYVVFFQPEQNLEYLAGNYVDTHLQQLSQTMDSSPDNLQLGISAYNDQEYGKALDHFQIFLEKQPDNYEAIKNIGLVYLMTEEYDKALQQFDELADMGNTYSNRGMFLKSVTLLKRNETGDEQEAINLLQQVVRDQEEGSEQAEEWLERQ